MWAWVASVEWYWWAGLAAIAVGIVWKIAGWPGLLALAAGAGFILGRRSTHDTVEVPDEDPPHIKRLKQSQRKPVDPKSAYQKWIRGEE
jgi:hypothetical protein